MKFYEIAIIGAGQLGSRYLQGLAKCSVPLSIHVIDPNVGAIETALARYGEIGKSCEHRIVVAKRLNELPSCVDLAIIATSADVRYAVLKNLLSVTVTNYMILEKILFQSLAQYEGSWQLLSFMRNRIWVNCFRRTIGLYQEIRDNESDYQPSLCVSGSNWGLACNAIHYVDLWKWLGATLPFEWDTSELDAEIIPSKRNGFVEITGTLRAKTRDGASLELICSRDSGKSFTKKIQLGNKEWIINLKEEIVKYCTGKHCVEKPFKLPYQSDITNVIVEQILLTGRCNLTPLEESLQLHSELMPVLLAHICQGEFDKETLCQIT